MKKCFINSNHVLCKILIIISSIICLTTEKKLGVNNLKTSIDFSLYHKTEQIYENLRNLANGNCKNKLNEIKMTNDKNSPFYNILSMFTITNTNSKLNKLKIFINTGEHARELISVELIYNFINLLCENESKVK